MARADVFVDCFGRRVRLTAERRRHILEHPEMAEWMDSIGDVLLQPGRVVRSGSDPEAELFYVWKTRTRVGPKYLCVVVIARPGDAFVVTAYLTDSTKMGVLLWPRRHP